MDIQRKKGLLDVCVLSVLKKAPSYGYELIGAVSQCIPISESTLYPILKRLESSIFILRPNIVIKPLTYYTSHSII